MFDYGKNVRIYAGEDLTQRYHRRKLNKIRKELEEKENPWKNHGSFSCN